MTMMGVSNTKSNIKVALTGNESIARGALEAGVGVAFSYPGSPTAEVLGTLSKLAKQFNLYTEWSINEKVAMEGAAAASFAGLRSLVIMKADGLNVALDFVSALALSGTRAGMVIVVGDDPGAHSSVREEDSRNLCKALHLPILEPAHVQEAKDVVKDAFDLSEKLQLPVVVRCVTRVCHASGDVLLGSLTKSNKEPDFNRQHKFITFSIKLHQALEAKLAQASNFASDSKFNIYHGPQNAKRIIIASGPCYLYALEALDMLGIGDQVGVLKLATTWPLPEKLLVEHLKTADEVVFAEEVEPFVEDNVMALAARNLDQIGNVKFYGKTNGQVAGPHGAGIGELDPDVVAGALAAIWNLPYIKPAQPDPQQILETIGGQLPGRELALCAGCPHRASFWSIKTALELDGRGGVVLGDIGCYTLGIARTGYYLLQTMHCMGAGVGIAAGMGQLNRFGYNKPVITVLGDSTFYHAALPALVNARYHQADFMCVILDNETTAMTGHQPHPGRELTAMGEPAVTIPMEQLIAGIGLPYKIQDPYDIKATTDAVYQMLQQKGPRVLILRRSCVLVAVKGQKKNKVYVDQNKCIGDDCGCARFCSKVFACPANIWDEQSGKARIDEAVCNGCGVCTSLCPQNAIVVERTV